MAYRFPFQFNVFSSLREGLKILYNMSPTSSTRWPRHPVDFECILSPWTALSPYFFNIRQSIQRTPEIRLPLSRVGNIPSFLVFAGVQSPCLKQSCIRVHVPAVPTAMFPRYSEDSLSSVLPSQAILSFVDVLYKPVSQPKFFPMMHCLTKAIHSLNC